MTNIEIADRLQNTARELRVRHENLFRVKAYRRAAEAVMRLDRPIEDLVHERGSNALVELPGIGKHLARTIADYVETGMWSAKR